MEDRQSELAQSSGRFVSLQKVIDQQNGRTTGFDLMRIVLAFAVVLFHTIPSAMGGNEPVVQAWNGPYRPIFMLILPSFFALSGFLVAGSLERTPTLREFLALRAIRLVPALAVEVFLCAVILGSLVTTLPLREYFSDPQFWRYFLNIIGHIQYELPGVFKDLPTPGIVNVSLWTVPYELECYVTLAILVIVGIVSRRHLFLAMVLVGAMLAPFVLTIPPNLDRPLPKLLVFSFLWGVLLFKYRDRVLHNFWLMLGCLLVAMWTFKTQKYSFWGAPLCAYATVYFGLLRAPVVPVLSKGDYSYGLYLFAFPLQQLHSYLFPASRIWYYNFGFALATGLIYAGISWHLIEKPILGKRKKIIAAMESVVQRGKILLESVGRRATS